MSPRRLKEDLEDLDRGLVEIQGLVLRAWGDAGGPPLASGSARAALDDISSMLTTCRQRLAVLRTVNVELARLARRVGR